MVLEGRLRSINSRRRRRSELSDWPFGYRGGGGGNLNKKIFWFLICKKKNNMVSKIPKKKKKILDPYDGNDSILFDISKCCWLLTPFSTYILSETINYVYIIFHANRILSSATSHHSYISLASTNNIWGIKMTFKENLCFWLLGNTSHSHIFPCNLHTQKNCEYHSV